MEAQSGPSSLPPAVQKEPRIRKTSEFAYAYYAAEGVGCPVLLVHSINAAASAYEMKPVFEALTRGGAGASRPVFLVDLPGFGRAEQGARRYDVRLYTDTILDMLEVIEASGAKGPIHALALSLSSEFLARAAMERPDRFRSLGFINPTGFSRGSHKLTEPGANKELPGFAFVFEDRPWSRALFDLLTREASIRYFLRRTYGSRDVDEDLVAYDVLCTRQPGAHHAPFAFLSGRLFSKDIRTIYESLTIPIWVPHGTRGDFRDFSETGWAESRGNWRFEAFASGAMPHFEHPSLFEGSMLRFLDET